jgi:hypothetical protein
MVEWLQEMYAVIQTAAVRFGYGNLSLASDVQNGLLVSFESWRMPVSREW